MTAFRVLIGLLILAGNAFAQLKIEPESPAWGTEIVVTAESTPPGAKSLVTIYQNDRLYALLATTHQGVWRSTWVAMTRDGSRFVARLRVPEGCEWGTVGLFSNEHSYITRRPFLPRTPDGSYPPGALVAGMNRGNHDRKNWKKDIETDLAPMAEKGWAYKEIWGLRSIAMGNLRPEELLAELRKVEQEKESPGLLYSLVYGYFLAGQPKTALDKLTRLCHSYSNSPYAVMALHDAAYLTFSRGWKEYDQQLVDLRAKVANTSPQNSELWNDESNAVFYLHRNSGVTAENLKRICALWMEALPTSYGPYLVLALTMADAGTDPGAAEDLASKAIEHSYLPTPNSSRATHRGLAYRTRSKLRVRKGDLNGALADTRMAQAFARKGDTDDLDAEADLWLKIGYPSRAEDLALEACRMGSLAAEGFVKKLYVSRIGKEDGFPEYFLARLTGEKREISTSALPSPPPFKGTTLEGVEFDSEKLKGSIVAINFWFINCGPCRGEMPELNKIVDEFKGRVRFLAFASDPAEDLRSFLKSNSFKYETVPGDNRSTSEFSVRGYPTHFIIGRDGRIVWEATGASPANIEKLHEMLRRLTANEIVTRP